MKKLPQKYLIKGIKDNQHVQITLLSTSLENAKEQSLNKYNIYPIEIKALSGFEFLHLQILRLDNKITKQDIAALFMQISTMLSASLPILEVIEVCAKNTKKSPLKRTLLEIAYRLNLGQKLSLAFKEHRAIFGDMTWNMIALGEKSGELGEIFKMLSNHLIKEYKNKGKIKRALFYPTLVLLSIIGAFIGLVLFVLPEFLMMFEEFKVNLPIYTRILIHLKSFFTHFGLLFCVLVCGGGLMLYRFYKHSQSFRHSLHAFVLHIPLIGEIIKLNMFYQYTFTLFLQLKSATPLDMALSLSNNALYNLALRAAFIRVLESIKNGKSLSLALTQENVIDDISLALIAAGEQSGKLPEMLEVCAKRFEEIAQEKIDFLISLIEPLLSLVMGILLLFLALGVFVPMWDMSSAAING
ncbi:type II secretion system F family protein [uncultured Helicobacter sp.]|uniref:type II secretion system F family protein n=1 Tax=uncultured Helicobacter sp. TaxID=175537 RepID=UPI0026345324|nr:type II secretion system F family protein [uncultured Helicobacter sp.]